MQCLIVIVLFRHSFTFVFVKIFTFSEKQGVLR
jgi:hypothetical protein